MAIRGESCGWKAIVFSCRFFGITTALGKSDNSRPIDLEICTKTRFTSDSSKIDPNYLDLDLELV